MLVSFVAAGNGERGRGAHLAFCGQRCMEWSIGDMVSLRDIAFGVYIDARCVDCSGVMFCECVCDVEGSKVKSFGGA